MSRNNFNGFLHLNEILQRQNDGVIFTVHPDEENDIVTQIQNQIDNDKGAALDLRLGSFYYLSGDKAPRHAKDDSVIKINPGQFGLLTTYEIFHMPKDLLAFISMRFSDKAKGLINVSGFQVDPGYDGLFIFSVYNAGPRPVNLKYKSRTFTILFTPISEPVQNVKHGFHDIPIDKWDPLTSTENISLIGLDNRVKKLEWQLSLFKYGVPIGSVITAILYYAFQSGGNSI